MKTIENFNRTDKLIEKYTRTGSAISIEDAMKKINQDKNKINDRLNDAIADREDLKLIMGIIRENNGNQGRCIETLEQLKANEVKSMEEAVKNGNMNQYTFMDNMSELEPKYKILKEKIGLIFEETIARAGKGEIKGWKKIEEEYMEKNQNQIDKLEKNKTELDNKYNGMSEKEIAKQVAKQIIESEIREIGNEIMEEESQRGQLLQNYEKREMDNDNVNALRENVEKLRQKKEEYSKFLNENIIQEKSKDDGKVTEKKSFWKKIVEKVKGIFKKPQPMLDAPKTAKEAGPTYEEVVANTKEAEEEFMAKRSSKFKENYKVNGYEQPNVNNPTIQLTTHQKEEEKGQGKDDEFVI